MSRDARYTLHMRQVSAYCAVAALIVILLGAGVASQTDPHASKSSDETAIVTTPSKTPEGVAANPGTKGSTADPPPEIQTHNSRFGILATEDSPQEKGDFPEGKETATPVTPRQLPAFPYRAVVLIASTVNHCSGWLYGPDIVLTAGHCVVVDEAWAKQVVVTVRQADARVPFQKCGARRLYSTAGWKDLKDERYDYGAIKLDCRVGDQVGWIGYGWATLPTVGDEPTLIGYRGVRQGSVIELVLKSGPGAVMALADQQVFYTNATQHLTSGAPVLAVAGSNARAVAVHASGCHAPSGVLDCKAGPDPHTGFNHGPTITRAVFENMQAWKTAPVP